MVQVDALEMIAYPGQLSQSAITDGPVGQQAREYGEDVERATSTHGIGIEEGRYQHVGTIGIHRIGILNRRALILCLYTITEGIYLAAELVKRRTVIAIVGIAHTLECTAQGDRGHGETATIGGG